MISLLSIILAVLNKEHKKEKEFSGLNIRDGEVKSTICR